MIRRLKMTLLAALVLLAVPFFTGCSQEATPYERNDGENYCVSVKFDANGGFFTTNTSVIVDSYNISEMQAVDGRVQIPLLEPDDPLRGNDAFTAVNNGYFLAGWYTERTGDTYGGKWDFDSDRLTVDASGTYSASEPVLTLYAAWAPLFEIQFYDFASGDYLDSYTFSPEEGSAITVPALNPETGAMDMYKFPKRTGYTFAGAYYDAAGTRKVDTAEVRHTGVLDEATGTVADPVMKLYVDWTEGEWYHIYNVEQFLDNASVSGCYILHEDLDFEGKIWPSSLMYGNFSGQIQGNGHTIRNVSLEQTNNSKINSGLFGYLTETARIQDVHFENVHFTIKAGARVTGASFGLFAGSVSPDAKISGVTIADSILQVDSGCYFASQDYSIGLLCGMGSVDIAPYGITAAVVGDSPEKLILTVDGGMVTIQAAAA